MSSLLKGARSLPLAVLTPHFELVKLTGQSAGKISATMAQ